MSAVGDLATAVVALQVQIAQTETDLQRRIDSGEFGRFSDDLTPDDMRSDDGRPILLDARAALVMGLSALVLAAQVDE